MVNKPLTDLILLAASLLASAAFSGFLYKDPAFSAKKGAIFLLVFFATVPFMNMWAHEFAIGITAFHRWQQGHFAYDFRFYSLMLLGAVFILMNGYLLHQIGRLSRGGAAARRRILAIGTLQILFSLPLFPLNPIGLLPVLATALLFLVLTYSRRREFAQKKVAVTA